MNVLPYVYICSHRKKSTLLLREGTVKCTQQPRKFTEYANWNKRKWHYSENKDLSRKWYCQTLKAFRIISTKMKISLLILSWRCFSYLHIQGIDIQYTDQLFWKIKILGTVYVIFINKLQFPIFSIFLIYET